MSENRVSLDKTKERTFRRLEDTAPAKFRTPEFRNFRVRPPLPAPPPPARKKFNRKAPRS